MKFVFECLTNHLLNLKTKLKEEPKHEKPPKNENDFRPNTLQKWIATAKQVITLEPLVVCYVLAKAMIDPALKNLELEKACRVNSQFNETVCSTITSGTYEKNNFTRENSVVQSYITDMHSWQLTATNVLAIVLIVLLGSFSDRYQIRKPFILLTLFGQILAIIGCILCVHFFEEWPLEVQGFLQEVVYAMFGGEKLLLMMIYAYITDISTPHMRTVRMSIIQAIWNICYTIGQSAGGATFSRYTNYMYLLSVGLVLFVIAFVYGLFIEESRKSSEKNDTRKIVLDIFNPHYFVETFKIFTRYKGDNRINIISLLVVQLTYSIVTYGELSVLFLFTQIAYEWTVSTYTLFYSLTTITNSIGLFVIVPLFTKGLKLDDLLIVALSNFSRILSNIIILVIRSPAGLYISCATGILKTLALVGLRSQLTKYVSENDVGKILSVCTVIDSFGEGVSSQIYNNGIYKYTRATFPEAFLLLGIALLFFGIMILVWMYVKKRIQKKEDPKSHPPNSEVNNKTFEIEITHL